MTPIEFTHRFDYDPDNDLLSEGGFKQITSNDHMKVVW